MHRDGIALGTFVVAFDPRAPLSPHDRELASETASLCGVILAYRRNHLKHELLVGELQHRVRNLFSSISAVVYATLKAHPEPEFFRETFDGRLMALSRAHRQALDAKATDLRELLTETLAPYSGDHDVTLEGPALLLTEEAAVAFSLAAHELATNAAKFGALSNPSGSLRVSWTFDSAEDDRFVFTWCEVGGPPVSPPRRQGFGHRLLHRSIASAVDGKVELDYLPDGLVCIVTAPQSARLGARVP